MRDIHALLFDADGTLLDTYDLIVTSMRHTVNDVAGGNYGDEELMARVGTPLLDQMVHFADGDSKRAEELTQLYREHNDSIHDERIKAFPGTKEALQMLADAGFRMGVVTSKRHYLANRGLEMCGLAGFFDVLIGSGRSCAGASFSTSLPHSAPTSATARSTSRRATPQDV